MRCTFCQRRIWTWFLLPRNWHIACADDYGNHMSVWRHGA